MHLSVSPQRLEAIPGVPQRLTITLSNPGSVIGGYTVRVLGADPTWVELDDSKISLFPDESKDITATITVPDGLVAGERRMAVQVRELTPPERSMVEEIVLVVPEAPRTRVQIDPVSMSIGRSGRFSLLIENAGNTTLTGWLAADDHESKMRARFEPREVELAPGEHVVADLRLTGKRPFAGAPAVRTVNVHLVEGHHGPPAAESGSPSLEVRSRKRTDPFAPPDPEAQPAAVATVLQKALLSRGPIGLVGLLAAITIFAIVITLALSRIVGQSAQDRNLALQIAAAREQAQSGGSSGLAGTVRELTSGSPAKGVAVAVYSADDLVDPVATLATGTDGSYRVNGLSAGEYKVNFRGAGFQPLWYPAALDSENAEVVKVEKLNRVAGLDVSLSGEPASISGQVNGGDVEDATVTLQLPSTTLGLDPTAPGGAASATTTTTSTSAGDEGGAVVDTVPVGADGRFSFAGVPSPSEYDVVVSKEGFANTTTRVDVAAGEERKGVELNLRKGDGIVKGEVLSDGRPLEGVTLTATSGETSVASVSLDDGTFTLLQLPTPATYTLVATKDRYASQALSLTVNDSEPVTGISMSLGASSTSLGGHTLSADGSQPLGGVTVTVTDGTQIIQTASRTNGDVDRQSPGGIGNWSVSGLSIPGAYTVTFTRADLATQTVSVDLDSTGRASPVDALMQPATGSLTGRVWQPNARNKIVRAGEVTVELTSGTTSFTVTTASTPDEQAGRYQIDQIPPGTYTVTMSKSGVRPTSTIMEIVASTESQTYSPTLAKASSLAGFVVRNRPGEALDPVGRGYVVLLYRASQYPGPAYDVTTTNDNGAYSFVDIDAPEAYVVEVRRSRGGIPIGTALPTVRASVAERADVRVSDND